ncbi:hypothetical protein [Niallia sp. MER TA 168]|uniref:hypothetical protein n=1 Tax=Niallia sp. MER TA 168 TaxID=2939568 RepID=UPI00203EE8DC|nr:hypothetical protein [Niallia sp. MER TA 168]MCM3362259.1 hypothetical protein [Niallia sp. MER TA 168]
MNNDFVIFSTRSFWQELEVPFKTRMKKFNYYFGKEKIEIKGRELAVGYFFEKLSAIQVILLDKIKEHGANKILIDLFKMLDESYHFYKRQKEARYKLKELNINSGAAFDQFEINRNITRNIIDSTNIWIENSLLYQSNSKDNGKADFNLDFDLLLDIYIYGALSQGLSLLSLCKKFENDLLFQGLKIDPDSDNPIEAIKEHPIIYFNTALTGNQNILSDDYELKTANKSDFGLTFQDEFGVSFLQFLALLEYIQKVELNDGQYALKVIDKDDFIKIIESATRPAISALPILENFTLTKERVKSQLRKREPVIWNIGVNRFRNELCPFSMLDNGKVLLSYCNINQAFNMWLSYFFNGGMAYTNKKDSFTKALYSRNEALSYKLVSYTKDILNKKYGNSFCEIDVDYQRIYGPREINYGDFDLIFYNKEINELFLIEAKYFSDSLNSSGMINDYEKLLINDGYYERCRRRYDLVLGEPDSMKAFIGAKGNVNVHFIFLSSKPIEISFQDRDGIVTFLCLDIFEKYLAGKLISDEDESIVRPTYVI